MSEKIAKILLFLVMFYFLFTLLFHGINTSYYKGDIQDQIITMQEQLEICQWDNTEIKMQTQHWIDQISDLCALIVIIALSIIMVLITMHANIQSALSCKVHSLVRLKIQLNN